MNPTPARLIWISEKYYLRYLCNKYILSCLTTHDTILQYVPSTRPINPLLAGLSKSIIHHIKKISKKKVPKNLPNSYNFFFNFFFVLNMIQIKMVKNYI